MNTTLKTKHNRSKSETPHQKLTSQCKNKLQRTSKGNFQAQTRRCHCCNEKYRYPDYLADFRRKRIERLQRKAIAEAFMDCPIPLVQSKHVDEETFIEPIPDQHNFISRLSNKVSQYEITPKKSIIQSFHESIIRSHQSAGRSLKNQLKQKSKHISNHEMHNQFFFQIKIQNPQTGEVYKRRFTAPEYGGQAMIVIEDILAKAI